MINKENETKTKKEKRLGENILDMIEQATVDKDDK